ncbi:MAG: pectinesterase family protein [Phycisphaerae bacterium]
MFSLAFTRPVRQRATGAVLAAIAVASFFPNFAAAEDYYVNPNGVTGGNTFSSLQAAIDAAPAGTAADPTRLFLSPGVYESQQITISGDKPYLDIIGTGASAADTVIEYGLNANSVVGGATVGTGGSSSVNLYANDFTASNVTFANTTAQPAPGAATVQALAILSEGDQEAFTNCNFIGFQDTMYLANGRSYFQNCFVNGTVDYVFGNGTAVFQNSTLNSAGNAGGGACVVTAANTAPTTAVGFVFLNSTLTGNPTPTSEGGNIAYQSGVASGNAYLGRAWQYQTSNASVTYINTKMGSVVNSQGWALFDSNEVPTNLNPRFSEYNSMDANGNPLDVSSRVSWSNQLVLSGSSNPLADASNYTLGNIFGPESYWGAHYTGTFALGGTWNPLAQISTTVVPAPATFATLMVGTSLLLLFGRRRGLGD